GRKMELLVFGHAGTNLLVFPISMGRFFDYEDRGMVDALQAPLREGRAQLFCVDSVDAESWYNYEAPPRNRVTRHMAFERYILEEVLPFVGRKNNAGTLAVTGCSFGGYHAMNLTPRHPERVSSCISLGGAFDIKQFIAGFYDSDCYFNNPVDYLPNLTDTWYIDLYRRKVSFVLATGERDVCLKDNIRLARMLDEKGIPRILDVWGDGAGHDWPWWRGMIAKFVR
ncbi:MAG TPA: alpha/beta fold hydrolase, partial [Bacteroidota bacterium]